MAITLIVAGESGTGKSRSIVNLPPNETFVINVLNKPLPFKGSAKLFNTENKNIISTDSYSQILAYMDKINEVNQIKYLIIDDIGFVMTTELFARAKEQGYNKFTEIGVHMQQIISKCKSLRNDLNIALIFHEEDDTSDRLKVGKKIKTIGQMLEDKYNPVETVSTVLFTDVKLPSEADGKTEYRFVTNRTAIGGITIPAKSPEGCFSDLFIPNDLKSVFDTLNKYYNE